MEFTPSHSVPAFLAFLAAGFVFFVAGVVLGIALLARRYELARRIFLGALVGGGLYLIVLLAVSLVSQERVLALGEQKYFCEVDCHLAYSVENVTATKTLGTPPQQKAADGIFYVVTVKVWFDERTISSTRAKNMPLVPNYRRLAVVDEAGRSYGVSLDGLKALEQAEGRGGCLGAPLRPGESHTTRLVFDLSADAHNPRLLIATADLVAPFIIGHESSPLHRQITFRLEPQSKPGARGFTAKAGPGTRS